MWRYSKPEELVWGITDKLTKFGPRGVRWSLAVRPSAPRSSSPSRLRSNCDPNGRENADCPLTNPPAEGWMWLREESEGTRVYLSVTVREERREVFTHISPPCRSSRAALPGWIKHCTTPTVGWKLTQLPGDGWKPVKHTGLIFTTQFMDQNTHLTWRTWRSNHG